MGRDLNGRQQQYEAELARLEPMQAELDDWMLDVRGLHGLPYIPLDELTMHAGS